MSDVSLFRLYLLRVGYFLIAYKMGMQVWPSILDPSKSWELMQSIVVSMLGAIALLACFGVRYPLQMLPLLLFEMAWKSIWLLKVALPLWLSDQAMDAPTARNTGACLMGVIFLIIIPWRYVFEHYVRKPGDRWTIHRTLN